MDIIRVDCSTINAASAVVSGDLRQLDHSVKTSVKRGWFRRHTTVHASLNIYEVYSEVCQTMETLEEFKGRLEKTMQTAMEDLEAYHREKGQIEIPPHIKKMAVKPPTLSDKVSQISQWVQKRFFK